MSVKVFNEIYLHSVVFRLWYKLFRQFNRFADNNNGQTDSLQNGIYIRRIIADKTIYIADFRRQLRLQ